MRHFGWDVAYDRVPPGEIRTWTDILRLTGGQPPHAVLVADTSAPPLLLGMEGFPCLTIFYSVDSHIHSWHPVYAQGFDLCLVSLSDRLTDFHTGRLGPDQVLWSPPFARDQDRPPAEQPDKQWDLLFVGTMRPELAPERCAFLHKVRGRFPGLHTTTGDYAALYSKARLLLNECTNLELNFRVFEALGCGGCLLTPDIGPALSALFTDNRELVLYPPGDADAVAEIADALLSDPARRERIAASGLAAIDAGHRARHRARVLAQRLDALVVSGEAGSLIAGRQKLAARIAAELLRPLYLHHAETVGVDALRQAYLGAALNAKPSK